jgi:hypothetical protein
MRRAVILWVLSVLFFHCAGLRSRAYLRLFATMSSSMAELLDTSVKSDQTLFSTARRAYQVL